MPRQTAVGVDAPIVGTIDSLVRTIRTRTAAMTPMTVIDPDNFGYETYRVDNVFVRIRASWGRQATTVWWDYVYLNGVLFFAEQRDSLHAAGEPPAETARVAAYYRAGTLVAWRQAAEGPLQGPTRGPLPAKITRLASQGAAAYTLVGADSIGRATPARATSVRTHLPGGLTNEERIAVRQAVRRSSVRIDVTYADGGGAHGSGVVVWRDGATAVVLTNAHVVEDSLHRVARLVRIMGTRSARQLPAAIAYHVKDDPGGVDGALLVVDDPEQLLGAAVERAADVRPGDPVLAVGNPLDESFLVDEGIVTRVRPTQNGQQIAHNALIEHGSSGGGLFTIRGELVGLTTYINDRTQEGIALATTPLLTRFRFRRVQIAADSGWQDSGVLLNPGGRGALVVATGSWRIGPIAGATGPAGRRDGDRGVVDTTAAHGALLVRVGPNGRSVAVDRWWPTAEPGPALAALNAPPGTASLRFRINDVMTRDNSGALTVLVIEFLDPARAKRS